MKNRIIVVGTGMAGLTAAAYVLKKGKEVTLFEKQDKTGGLVHSFRRDGFLYDAGLRSIENSGIVYPMLKDLGIDMEFTRSRVSVGIADRVITLDTEDSLRRYRDFLVSFFPESPEDVDAIIAEIDTIMKYMDVLYDIDNPLFLDLKSNPGYIVREILPWLVKYLFTIGKIDRLNTPVDDYLEKLTKNRRLIDIIAQHFFKKTPTFFALSYFSLYLDYRYPMGGTGMLAEKMEAYVREHGGKILLSTPVKTIHPEDRYILDSEDNRYEYDALIWTADLKALYNSLNTDDVRDGIIQKTILYKRTELKDLEGGDSVFTVYLAADLPPEYFAGICSEHFFYTPGTEGLSSLDATSLEEALAKGDKEAIKSHLSGLCALNTYEISIPVLRDSTLAPEGKTGLVISLLFDYPLARKIHDLGWYDEFKEYMEGQFIRVLNAHIFPGLEERVIHRFSSTPLTIEGLTGSTGGAITGWAFTNTRMPVINKMKKIFHSVKTPVPGVLQAGQWSYSPSGLPISILTGKLAADRALKTQPGTR